MNEATYRRRCGTVWRGEREWRVERQGLVEYGQSGPCRRVLWRDVTCVRLVSAPSRTKPWRYVFALNLRDGRKIKIDNVHRLRFGTFEDRSVSYSAFVRAALARLAEANPAARALVGETSARYFALLLVSLVGLGAAAVAIALAPVDGVPFAGLIKLALIVAMLPIFARWVLGAAPKGVALDAVPAHAMPPASPCAEADEEAPQQAPSAA